MAGGVRVGVALDGVNIPSVGPRWNSGFVLVTACATEQRSARRPSTQAVAFLTCDEESVARRRDARFHGSADQETGRRKDACV